MANRLQNQAVYIGPKGSLTGMDEASLTYPGQLGMTFRVADKSYQVVLVGTAAAAPAPADGIVAFWIDRTLFKVGDLGDATRNDAMGLHTGAITAGNYGVVQVGGRHSNALTAGSPAIGDYAIPNSGTAGDVTPITIGTAPTHVPVGRYASTASSSRASVDITAGVSDNS